MGLLVRLFDPEFGMDRKGKGTDLRCIEGKCTWLLFVRFITLTYFQSGLSPTLRSLGRR